MSRSYNSASRKAKATETKARILSTAKELFMERGYEKVSIEELAKSSDVAASTIYALFKSKRGLLKALLDSAYPQEAFQKLVTQAAKEVDPSKRLRISAKIAREMYDAEKEFMDLFQGAALLSPELKEIEKQREERRYQRQKEFGKLTGQKLDVAWAFTGRDLYRLLVIERGWSSDEYEEWLGRTLVDVLM